MTATLVKGGRGIFEVKVDGRLVSKKANGVFPTEREVVAAVREALLSRSTPPIPPKA